MSATGHPDMGFEAARDVINDDPRIANLPGLTRAAARRWEIEEPEVLDLIGGLLDDLARRLADNGVVLIAEVTADDLIRWCTSAEGRLEPYERRSAIFIARSVLESTSGLMLGPADLTIGLPLLVEGRCRRPLLRIERASVRAAAHRTRSGMRDGHANRLRRAVIALAEAGGTTNEIPHVAHVDILRGNATVTFAGTRDTARRRVKLTNWGRTQINDALEYLEPGQMIAYQGAEKGQGRSSAASVSGVAKRALREAGLTDKDVTTESLRNTAALDVWDGRDLQPVLDRLGLTTKQRVQKAWELVHFFDNIDR